MKDRLRYGEMIALMMNLVLCNDKPKAQNAIADYLKRHGYLQRDKGYNLEPTPKAYRSSRARKGRRDL